MITRKITVPREFVRHLRNCDQYASSKPDATAGYYRWPRFADYKFPGCDDDNLMYDFMRLRMPVISYAVVVDLC